MDFFQIIFKPTAEDELRKLPKELILKVSSSIENLSVNPYLRTAIKLSGEDAYRIRIGDYRVTYNVYKEEKVI